MVILNLSSLIKNAITPINSKHAIDPKYGFQINESDLQKFGKVYYDYWKKTGQIDSILDEINKKGYVDSNTGNLLSNLLDSGNYIYLKTVNSIDLESIYKNGVYCNNNTTSGMFKAINDIADIDINNTATKVDGLYEAFLILKNANGISQGGNPINGTLIISIPKNIDQGDIYIWNIAKECYVIDPKYIVCFAENVGDGIVKPIYFRSIYSTENNSKIGDYNNNETCIFESHSNANQNNENKFIK